MKAVEAVEQRKGVSSVALIAENLKPSLDAKGIERKLHQSYLQELTQLDDGAL